MRKKNFNGHNMPQQERNTCSEKQNLHGPTRMASRLTVQHLVTGWGTRAHFVQVGWDDHFIDRVEMENRLVQPKTTNQIPSGELT